MARMVYLHRPLEQEPGRERPAPFYDNSRPGRYDRGTYRSAERERYGEVDPIGFVPSARMAGRRSPEPGMERGGSESRKYKKGLSRRETEAWVKSMVAADGSKMPIWELHEVERLAQERGVEDDIVELWAGMNALYADLCSACADHGITAEDDEFWLDIAIAFWLCDEDAVEDKLGAYYQYITE